MSDQVQEILDLPRDFVKEGSLFINRCTKPDGKEFVRPPTSVTSLIPLCHVAIMLRHRKQDHD